MALHYFSHSEFQILFYSAILRIYWAGCRCLLLRDDHMEDPSTTSRYLDKFASHRKLEPTTAINTCYICHVVKQHLSEPFNSYSPFLSFHTTLGRGFLSEFLCQPPPLGQTDTFGPVRGGFIHPFSPLRDPTLNLNIPGPWSCNGNGKIAFVKDRSQFLNVA